MCLAVFSGGVLAGHRLEGWLLSHVTSSLNADKGRGGVDRPQLQEAVLVSFVVVTNRERSESRFQGYLLAADSRQEIKTICDKALLLTTDGSSQIPGANRKSI